VFLSKYLAAGVLVRQPAIDTVYVVSRCQLIHSTTFVVLLTESVEQQELQFQVHVAAAELGGTL